MKGYLINPSDCKRYQRCLNAVLHKVQDQNMEFKKLDYYVKDLKVLSRRLINKFNKRDKQKDITSTKASRKGVYVNQEACRTISLCLDSIIECLDDFSPSSSHDFNVITELCLLLMSAVEKSHQKKRIKHRFILPVKKWSRGREYEENFELNPIDSLLYEALEIKPGIDSPDAVEKKITASGDPLGMYTRYKNINNWVLEAIEINDNSQLHELDRMKELKELFEDNNIELVFDFYGNQPNIEKIGGT